MVGCILLDHIFWCFQIKIVEHFWNIQSKLVAKNLFSEFSENAQNTSIIKNLNYCTAGAICWSWLNIHQCWDPVRNWNCRLTDQKGSAPCCLTSLNCLQKSWWNKLNWIPTVASYSSERVPFKWELLILHPSSLCCPSFLVEGKRRAGSSQLNEKLSFE